MARFVKGQSGNPAGRKPGSRNKKSLIDEGTKEEAKRQLQNAVESGEQWAIQAVIDRIEPKLKAVTPEGSLDGEVLELKIQEVTDLADRITKLEEALLND
ncbi:DUF5681 domain-containing protein [Vibrio variabilis]|uniref:DUF5681 domain-containing protein n=1 Tax=Vibrio variabilis TaxID=990271 RepID=UPI000DD70CFE|nr:DUF5681 domain-containing protein [Vibrio variabilis]